MSIHLKPILFGVLLVLFALPLRALAQKETQTFSARNAVYVEFGGGSGRYAVNYSKIFHQKGKMKLNASVGFSMWHHTINFSPLKKTTWLPVIPLEFSAFYGKSNHHLELGIGVTSFLSTSFAFDSETFETINKVVFDAFIPLRVGYKYQKPEGGFFFRVGYTPIIIFPTGGREGWLFEPRFAGISFGKSF